MYIEKGVLLLNTRSVTHSDTHHAKRKAARLLRFLKLL